MSTNTPSYETHRLQASDRRFAIVAARFNAAVVDRLIEGARSTFRQHGADDSAVEVFRCPGSLELPGLARRVANTGRFAGIVCLGVVIRGDTIHFDLVAEHAAGGIARLAEEAKLAVGNCILACENQEQAEARAGGAMGNKGAEAAAVVLEIANLYQDIVR
jgi:6,7-dimethyl-8-ribityllumazine synthase